MNRDYCVSGNNCKSVQYFINNGFFTTNERLVVVIGIHGWKGTQYTKQVKGRKWKSIIGYGITYKRTFTNYIVNSQEAAESMKRHFQINCKVNKNVYKCDHSNIQACDYTTKYYVFFPKNQFSDFLYSIFKNQNSTC